MQAASQIPLWIQCLQALGTPAIALAAAVIGGLQWYTAHRKVVVDLFDRRVDAYKSLREEVGKALREGRADMESVFAFHRAMDKAEFLFGREVNDYLEGLRLKIVDLERAREMTPEAKDDLDLDRWFDRKQTALEAIGRFYTIFPELIRPYMRLDQRAPDPLRWLIRRLPGRGSKPE